MNAVLIGHTGFVGANLASQLKFDRFYNSKNIEEIRGLDVDLLVCSGVRAEKWRANQDPVSDLNSIKSLLRPLENVQCRQAVLISTIDVYPKPLGVDETSEIEVSKNHPYGEHRLMVEKFFCERFRTTILRLPGLFGKGLKKNAIFDLVTKNQLDKINGFSSFQFYSLEWIGSDLHQALKIKVPLLNLSTEPVQMKEVARAYFSTELKGEHGTAVHYDIKSIHAGAMGGVNGYIHSLSAVHQELSKFIANPDVRR